MQRVEQSTSNHFQSQLALDAHRAYELKRRVSEAESLERRFGIGASFLDDLDPRLAYYPGLNRRTLVLSFTPKWVLRKLIATSSEVHADFAFGRSPFKPN